MMHVIRSQSLRTTLAIDDDVLAAAKHLTRVTDSYLLALAHTKGGRHATMDQTLGAEVVRGGKKALAFIQTD